MQSDPPPTTSLARDSRFGTTQWSLILLARADDPAARDALAELCERYWYPVYGYVRGRVGLQDAADLTQGFFTHLLESDLLSASHPVRGKFRAYLLACCNHFLSNERDKARAAKRGGGKSPLPLDFTDADSRYSREPAHRTTPEGEFNRRWALSLLDEVLTQLEREHTEGGKEGLYRALRPALTGSHDAAGYAAVAKELGMTINAVKKAAQRLRERYRALIRERVAATVDRPEQIDDEIRDLFVAVSG
jgi:DNA-directed RNA polymerase specialized sigma24 family protein